jgi:hypothetical protein
MNKAVRLGTILVSAQTMIPVGKRGPGTAGTS